jgi:peptide/nickel transport system substrate-binding protein
MRTVSCRLAFVLVAVAALVAVGAAGGASKAGPTFVIAGASDPTYLDPALVSDGESFRATEQIFESLVSLKPGRPSFGRDWPPSGARRTGRTGRSTSGTG